MKIATSILNSSDRIESVIKLNRTNTSYIHVDVMDGKFVSDKQFSVKEIKAVNLVTKYPMDVHLMVSDPLKYIEELSGLNISYITFHLEIKKDKKKIISKIKELGYKVGISIKPDTDLSELVPYLSDIDMILLMSVEPGMGGQKFLNSTVKRIKEIKKMIVDGGYNIEIEVDGGINEDTIIKLEDVDIAVVGSYIVKSDNYYRQIENLLKVFVEKRLISCSRGTKIGRIVSNVFVLIGFILMFIAFAMENFDLFFFILELELVIPGLVLLGLGFILKAVYSNEFENENTIEKITVKKGKKIVLYTILLGIGILPFILMICYGIYSSIFGFSGACFWMCDYDYGLVAFRDSISFFGLVFWPFLVVGLVLLIISVIKLNKIKRLSKK